MLSPQHYEGPKISRHVSTAARCPKALPPSPGDPDRMHKPSALTFRQGGKPFLDGPDILM
jgi:hypothetical protein